MVTIHAKKLYFRAKNLICLFFFYFSVGKCHGIMQPVCHNILTAHIKQMYRPFQSTYLDTFSDNRILA